MEIGTIAQPPKIVRYIAPTISQEIKARTAYRQLRVAAYCRVSTKQEEQLNSYEVQKAHYTERIQTEPDWKLVGIFADKGITGTSTKKRDEFNKLMRLCKQGKVDMIITKSISRFARNTVDCLQYTRMLKQLGVDVYFEEQGIHSTDNGAEFYITIYGSIAQSESENISANVRWGKEQSAKQGKVVFHYDKLLGYRKGENGQPEIDPEQAETVKFIYTRFLMGDSMRTICRKLEEKCVLTPMGKQHWEETTIRSILTNEKYKGDAIINKKYIVDCITKEVRTNNGERPKYYVENNHPAIITADMFARAQEELARRSGKRRVKQVGTKTLSGRYSSKYALTDLLVCGECKTPYRRCTWTTKDGKRAVWRCINRLDYGKKYCHNSPTMDEQALQSAIMDAIMKVAKQNADVLKTLKLHIGMGLEAGLSEDESLDIQIRIAEIDAEFKAMLSNVSTDTVDAFDEAKANQLLSEKNELQCRLDRITDIGRQRDRTNSRLEEIYTILESMKNHPMTYDDEIVRQLLECVIVETKEQIKVVLVGGMEVEIMIAPCENYLSSRHQAHMLYDITHLTHVGE